MAKAKRRPSCSTTRIFIGQAGSISRVQVKAVVSGDRVSS